MSNCQRFTNDLLVGHLVVLLPSPLVWKVLLLGHLWRIDLWFLPPHPPLHWSPLGVLLVGGGLTTSRFLHLKLRSL